MEARRVEERGRPQEIVRGRLVLFLLAILMPALGLVYLGVRILSQERELALNRLRRERSRLVDQTGEQMNVRLEAARLAAVAGSADTAISWLGTIDGAALHFPWDAEESGVAFKRSVSASGFAKAIAEARRVEYLEGRAAEAAERYAQAAAGAQDEAQRDYALLLAAQAQRKAGRSDLATTTFRTVLASNVVDEFGIPLALYAATALEAFDAEVLRRLLSRGGSLGPQALAIAGDLVERVDSSGALRTRLASEQSMVGEAETSRRNLGAVLAGTPVGRWIPFGTRPWLVGRVDENGRIMAVDAQEVVRQAALPDVLDQAGFAGPVVTLSSESTWPLRKFPGAYLSFEKVAEPPGESGSVRSMLLVLVVVFALGLGLSGSYLLWRDVRRETSMARLRSQFVSSVSHELKTPLTAIRMFAETIRHRNPAEAVREEYLDTIIHESERLTRLLSNVLDFSQIERGAKQYQVEDVDLVDVIRAAERAMAYPMGRNGIRLTTACDEVPMVRADRDALEQAVLNLLGNALKYSPPDGCIRLEVRQVDGEARISVSDEGVGVDPAYVDHLFDRFYRAPTEENRRVQGTGLGLALVKHVAEAHGGRASVVSRRGRGSTFTIHLPIET